MPTIHDVDVYLRQQLGDLNITQRHRLCYEVLRLGISSIGKPPFAATVITSADGPVFPGLQRPQDAVGDGSFDDWLRKLCAVVISRGISLNKLTRRQGQYPELRAARARGDNHISVDAIRAVTFLRPLPDRVIDTGDSITRLRYEPEFHVWNCIVEPKIKAL